MRTSRQADFALVAIPEKPFLWYASRRADSEGENMDASLRLWWDRASHASTAWGFLPSGLVSLVSAGLSYYAALPASLSLAVGLVSFAAAAVIFRFVPKPYSWISVTALVGVALWIGVSRYNDYKITFDGIEVGLVPFTIDRQLAGGAAVSVVVYNPNAFSIWVRVDRNTSILEGMAADVGELSDVVEIRPDTAVATAARGVIFKSPMRPEEIAAGRIDYQLCYGRSRDRLTKGLLIQGDYGVRFSLDQGITPVLSANAVRDNSCD